MGLRRLLLFVSACTVATFAVEGPAGGPSALARSAVAETLEITTQFTGLAGRGDLRDEMRSLSRIGKNEKGYTSVALLRRAVEQDARAMQSALTSKGFYAARVRPDVSREGLEATVTFAVELGERFTISAYRIEYDEQRETDRPTSFEALGEETSGDASGDALQNLESAVMTHLWNNGYPRAEPLGRFVEADFDAATAVAVFPIKTGPRSSYGEIRVSGTEKTEAPYIEALFRQNPGAIYRRREIDRYRQRLVNTNLFNTVSVEPGTPDEDGTTPLLVTIEERKHRTIGGGVEFATDVGIGVTAFWENRNLFGRGELLATELAYSLPRQEAGILYEKPLPRLPGSWNSTALFENEDTDAFEGKTITVATGLTKTFLGGNLEASGSVQYTYSFDIVDPNNADRDTFQAVSFPLAVRFNNENDRLNPTTGFRTAAVVEPFFGDLQFNRVTVGGATRYGFGEENTFLVAGRALLGGSLGASGTDLPATERFFAGGGGSVRGYAFQEAGPIDPTDGDPTGGASIAELNIEARYKITSSIQLALFADGGTVFESETPDFSGDFLVGAGLGVRYITPIGPIRVDIATPLDRREILRRDEMGNLVLGENGNPETIFEDDPVQLIIALGQPF